MTDLRNWETRRTLASFFQGILDINDECCFQDNEGNAVIVAMPFHFYQKLNPNWETTLAQASKHKTLEACVESA